LFLKPLCIIFLTCWAIKVGVLPEDKTHFHEIVTVDAKWSSRDRYARIDIHLQDMFCT
jgi:hypothetical protein